MKCKLTEEIIHCHYSIAILRIQENVKDDVTKDTQLKTSHKETKSTKQVPIRQSPKTQYLILWHT